MNAPRGWALTVTRSSSPLPEEGSGGALGASRGRAVSAARPQRAGRRGRRADVRTPAS